MNLLFCARRKIEIVLCEGKKDFSIQEKKNILYYRSELTFIHRKFLLYTRTTVQCFLLSLMRRRFFGASCLFLTFFFCLALVRGFCFSRFRGFSYSWLRMEFIVAFRFKWHCVMVNMLFFFQEFLWSNILSIRFKTIYDFKNLEAQRRTQTLS